MTVGIALLGFGRMAERVHAPALRRLREAAVLAVADPDPTRRAAAEALLPRARVVATAAAALDVPGVEAAIVAAPTHLHASLAADVLAAGCHVYVEKPLSHRLEDGRALVTRWRETALTGMVGFAYRFAPAVEEARALVRRGFLGPLVVARSIFTTPATGMPAWKHSHATGGGALLDLASHHVDLLRFILGREVAAVGATVRSRGSDDDTALLTLELEGDLLAQALVAFGPVAMDELELLGHERSLVVDRLRGTLTALEGSRSRRLVAKPLVDRLLAPDRERAFESALERFVTSCQTGRPAAPDLTDGLASLTVTVGAKTAAKRAETVRLDGRQPA